MNEHVKALCDAVGVDTDRVVEMRITPHPNGTGIRVSVKHLQSEDDGKLSVPLVYRHTERTV